jgi:Adenylate and Guanylate cyclase catalytic domain
MPAEVKKEIQLEIAHVLFIDIVRYSKLSINEQHAAVDELTQIVRGTGEFKKADASQRLIKIATGDGMASVFYTSPEGPVRCAIEVTHALKDHPRLRLRMGVHSGPVSGVIDVTERTNLAGAGLNLAQRVMNCGDAGHILLSKHVAEDLEEFEEWRPLLHNLGACEVKHGTEISIVNLYGTDFGNPELPTTFRLIRQKRVGRRRIAAALIAGAVITAGGIWFSRSRMGSSLGAPEKSIAVLPFENLSEDKSMPILQRGSKTKS